MFGNFVTIYLSEAKIQKKSEIVSVSTDIHHTGWDYKKS